jgi:hypothetical protein
MPFVPDQVSVPTAAFVLLLAAWIPVAVRERLRSQVPPQRAWVWLCAFYLSVALSLPIALSHGVPIGEWARAAVPFVFLTGYALFPALPAADCRFIVRCVLLATVCWLVKALALSLPQFLTGGVDRLTYITPDFQLPFTIVALPLMLFWAAQKRPLQTAAAVVVLGLVIIGTGYRSQALLMGLLWVAYVLTRKRLLRLKLLAATAILFTASAGIFVSSSFGEAWLARYGGVEEELQSQRGVEALYGLTRFRQAPLFGNGLGFPVPLAVNQFGAKDAPVLESDHVTYIHNAWIYFAMDLGLAGLFAYAAFFASVLFASRRAASDVNRAVAVCLVTLLAYFTVEAAFREVQMNFLLGALCAVLAKGERA